MATATPVVAFSPDGKLLAGLSGGQVRVWDVFGGEQKASFAATPRPVVPAVSTRTGGCSGAYNGRCAADRGILIARSP